MGVYRDRTYCPFTDCAIEKCNRRLTQAVEQAAELLRLPISKFMNKPDCFKAKE